MTVVVAALDIATKSGVAVDHPHHAGRPLCSTIALPKAAFDGDNGRRFAAFRRALVEALIVPFRPRLIIMEAPFIYGGATGTAKTTASTLRLLVGLCSIAEEVAAAHDVEMREIESATVRKHFLGSARGNREELKRATMTRCRQLGWEVADDNQADAAALWSYAKSIRDPSWAPASTPLFGGVR